jgi:hypothetical protein
MKLALAMKLASLCFLSCLFASYTYAFTGAAVIEFDQIIDMNRPESQCQIFERFLTSNLNAFCAVTGTGGRFAGGGEFGRVEKRNNGWFFLGGSCQPGIFFKVSCFR